jgi:3-deoxy-D-manno-octulosonic-acid transferase
VITITDNLGNYAEASTEVSEEESAGTAVTTFLQDSPDCTLVIVTRKLNRGELQIEMEKMMAEFNEKMGWEE